MTRDPHQDADDRPRARRPQADAPEPEPCQPVAQPVFVHSPTARTVRSRFRPTIETVLLASTAALLAAVAWPIASAGFAPDATPTEISQPPPNMASPVAAPTIAPDPAEAPMIQIALLLDTSSSMDGLIDQARSQLWRVVNALDSATYHGATPKLELALYEYGNDGLESSDGFIRQVSGFTVELDRVSEALFALTTNGGSEHAGQAIARSLDELQWRDAPGTLRVVYIAGNENFAQGPVDWRSAIERARAKGVVVNTVLCDGVDDDWSAAAAMAGGKFLQIDHNAVEQYIPAPQDDEIATLGLRLNETYVRYGAQGSWGMDNQMAQDGNVAGYGSGSVVQRSLSKGSKHYRNPTWDLVDALESKTVTLDEVERDSLSTELRGMSDAEIGKHLAAKANERGEIQAKLATLAKERELFLTAERGKDEPGGAARLDTAIVRSILEQAQAAGFTIDDNA